MKTQADKLKELINKDVKVRTIAVTSGKGGVGKTTLTANLGYALHKLGFKVALFDADIGLANLDVLLKVNSPKNILDVLKGEAKLEDVLVQLEENFVLIPGKSGNEIMEYATEDNLREFFSQLDMFNDYDFFLIDTGAGIDKRVQVFIESTDDVIVITVPEPAAITDAYAMVKILSEKRDLAFMLLNEVNSEKEAINIFGKIQNVVKANLREEFKLQMIGYLKKDKLISNYSVKRGLFVKEEPFSGSSEQVLNIAKKIAKISERKLLDEKKGLSSFFRKIFSKF